jgi:hypothetical protein
VVRGGFVTDRRALSSLRLSGSKENAQRRVGHPEELCPMGVEALILRGMEQSIPPKGAYEIIHDTNHHTVFHPNVSGDYSEH